MKKSVLALIGTLLTFVASCAFCEPIAFSRGKDVSAADQAPDIKRYPEKTPGIGKTTLIPRTFRGQPPLIPHAIEKYEPITIEENACLDCHINDDEFRGKKMPKMGASHFSKTVKQADGTAAVNMVRWQCNNCHVQQVDAPPLVENTFVGNVKQ